MARLVPMTAKRWTVVAVLLCLLAVAVLIRWRLGTRAGEGGSAQQDEGDRAVQLGTRAPEGGLALAAPRSRPRFVFNKGDVLTYQVHVSREGSAEGGALTWGSTTEAELVLAVQSVRADGIAEIKLTATGKGKETMGDETTLLDEARARPFILVAEPNGGIVELRDAAGKKISVWEAVEGPYTWTANTEILAHWVGDYALSGLHLPEKLPAPGQEYTGAYKWDAGGDSHCMKIELEDVSVTFVYKGPGKYDGRACLVFTCNQPYGGRSRYRISLPTTFYFDDEQGRLLAVEQGGKYGWLGVQSTVAESVKLVAPVAAN